MISIASASRRAVCTICSCGDAIDDFPDLFRAGELGARPTPESTSDWAAGSIDDLGFGKQARPQRPALLCTSASNTSERLISSTTGLIRVIDATCGSGHRLDRQRDLLAEGQPLGVPLGHRAAEPQRAGADQRDDRIADLHERAAGDVPLLHEPVERGVMTVVRSAAAWPRDSSAARTPIRAIFSRTPLRAAA